MNDIEEYLNNIEILNGGEVRVYRSTEFGQCCSQSPFIRKMIVPDGFNVVIDCPVCGWRREHAGETGTQIIAYFTANKDHRKNHQLALKNEKKSIHRRIRGLIIDNLLSLIDSGNNAYRQTMINKGSHKKDYRESYALADYPLIVEILRNIE